MQVNLTNSRRWNKCSIYFYLYSSMRFVMSAHVLDRFYKENLSHLLIEYTYMYIPAVNLQPNRICLKDFITMTHLSTANQSSNK